MTMTWFKVHHEIVDDIKIRRFTSQEKWAWIALLCLASKSSERGTIDADEDDIADYCEFNSTQDWLYYRDKLIVKGMIEIGASGKLLIVNWHKRQDRKPSDQPEQVKKRVAASRAKKKAESQSPPKPDLTVTPCNAIQVECNADVSPQNREEEIRLEKSRPDQTREENTRSENISQPQTDFFSDSDLPAQEVLISVGIAEEIQETPPPTPAPLAVCDPKLKTRRSVLQEDRETFMPFLVIWNRSAPSHWDRYEKLTLEMIDDLKKFTKTHKKESLQIFEEGLLELSADSFIGTPKCDKWRFCSYFTKNKPKKYSGYYREKQARSQQLQNNTDRPMTPSDIRKAETYLKYKEALTA